MKNLLCFIFYSDIPLLAIDPTPWLPWIYTLLAVSVIGAVFGTMMYGSRRRKRLRGLEKELQPQFSLADVRKSTQYYVPTHFQSNPPSQQSELILTHKITARQKLMPFFLQSAFKNDPEGQKFYMILAGSGMGKTTFMINLYVRYRQQQRKAGDPFEIKLLPLGSPDLIKNLEQVADPTRTILLLDALDEDPEAARRYRHRMERILNKARDFRVVVFTCRTQFFPSEEDEPRDTGVLRFDTRKGEHSFAKMYLSPFDEQDIRFYLRKRYGAFRGRTKQRAEQIVNQSPNLMVRPMLLSYIDDLLEEHSSFDYLSDLYRVLIQKWIDREAARVPETRREQFRDELYRFSREVALNIYANRKHRKGLFIGEREIKGFAERHQVKLEEMELKSRSLLNRNVMGQYKFAHKSILEYFLAMECVENERFAARFSFENMDQARIFFDERCLIETTLPFFQQQKEDATCRLDDQEARLVNSLEANEILQVRGLTFRSLRQLDPLRPLRKLESLKVGGTTIQDLKPLSELEQLVELDLNHTVISDLKPIAGLVLLQSLDVSHTRVAQLMPLQHLTKLRQLNMAHAYAVSLDGLHHLTHMDELNLSHTRVKDLDPLKKMKQLRVLNCLSTPIGNLGPLREVEGLTHLLLNHTQVNNLTALRNLKKLIHLDLCHTPVSNLRPLKSIKSLKVLHLDHSAVKDLSPLASLVNLEELSLREVSATQLKALQGLTRLRKVTLSLV